MNNNTPDILAQAASVAASHWQATEPTATSEITETTEPCGHCLGCRARKFSEEMLAMYQVLSASWRIGSVMSLPISKNEERGIIFVVLVNDDVKPAQIVTQLMIE